MPTGVHFTLQISSATKHGADEDLFDSIANYTVRRIQDASGNAPTVYMHRGLYFNGANALLAK